MAAFAGIFPKFVAITSGNQINMSIKSTAYKQSGSILGFMEDITSHNSVFPDLLAVASGLALAIVAILFWCVEVLAGQNLPIWYYLLGLAGMTAATYAQLQQRRGEDQ